MLRPPGVALSTAACSVAALGNGGYGGDMAGGEELSAPVDIGVSGRKSARGGRGSTQQLTADRTKGLVSSGASSLLRIERRRSPAMAMKTVVMAALQRVRGVVACRGGRGRRDGARRHSEGSRGRRWPRRYGGAAAAALGRVRERKQRRETRERERARGSRGSGRRRGDDARRRGGQAMQTSRVVAWRARARAPCPSSAYWREEEGDREEEVGWATQCWTSTGAGPALVGCTGEAG